MKPLLGLRNPFQGFTAWEQFSPLERLFLLSPSPSLLPPVSARGAHRHWEKTWGGGKRSQAGKHCGIVAPCFGVSAYLEGMTPLAVPIRYRRDGDIWGE